MNDTKLLALCILLAGFMISATIIWSTKANVEAIETASAGNGGSTAVSAATSPSSVTISGPVTLAPFAAPIPVVITTPNGTPITVKDVSEKQWTR
jgi:hypothetical protein